MPFAYMPSAAPHSLSTYFSPSPPMAEEQSPFRLWFISGNISKCAGCNNKYSKPPTPPYDLCVQHKEWRTFTPTAGGDSQSKFSPAYYHLNLPCIHRNWPMFDPQCLSVCEDVKSKMTPLHWEYLRKQGF